MPSWKFLTLVPHALIKKLSQNLSKFAQTSSLSDLFSCCDDYCYSRRYEVVSADCVFGDLSLKRMIIVAIIFNCYLLPWPEQVAEVQLFSCSFDLSIILTIFSFTSF